MRIFFTRESYFSLYRNIFSIFLILPLCGIIAQVDSAIYIDESENASGITNMTIADFNNDQQNDILLAQAYNSDQISIYLNEGEGEFSHQIIDDEVADPDYIAAGDLDDNGFTDIIAITQTEGELFWYPNANGNFDEPVLIDTEDTFGKNIAVADFDNNGTTDLVVIWQHAINFYSNDGEGNFTKEPILTTESSPDILECWTLTTADVNNDGNLDVITGETIGGVIYENDGNANFTPTVFTEVQHTTITALQMFDANNDGFLDVVMQGATGSVSLYLNEGNNQMNFDFHVDLLQTSGNIQEFDIADVNEDGLADVYTAFEGNPTIILNDENLSFEEQLILHEDEDLFIQEIATADITGNGAKEYIWAAAASPLAYHKLTTLEVLNKNLTSLKLYPNPASEKIHISLHTNEEIIVNFFDSSGRKVFSKKGTDRSEFDISSLASGMYFAEVKYGNKKAVIKVLKEE